MRDILRHLGIDNNRILDIQYPAHKTIGFLIHNNFANTSLEQLAKVNIQPIELNPLDPANLHDKK